MTRKAWDHGGKSRQARGYGREWEKLRADVLATEPLCRPCRESGFTTIATEVDHILSKAKGGTDDRSNLRPICTPCHRAKTIEDRGGKAKPKVAYDVDGWPIT